MVLFVPKLLNQFSVSNHPNYVVPFKDGVGIGVKNAFSIPLDTYHQAIELFTDSRIAEAAPSQACMFVDDDLLQFNIFDGDILASSFICRIENWHKFLLLFLRGNYPYMIKR